MRLGDVYTFVVGNAICVSFKEALSPDLIMKGDILMLIGSDDGNVYVLTSSNTVRRYKKEWFEHDIECKRLKKLW